MAKFLDSHLYRIAAELITEKENGHVNCNELSSSWFVDYIKVSILRLNSQFGRVSARRMVLLLIFTAIYKYSNLNTTAVTIFRDEVKCGYMRGNDENRSCVAVFVCDVIGDVKYK